MNCERVFENRASDCCSNDCSAKLMEKNNELKSS